MNGIPLTWEWGKETGAGRPELVAEVWRMVRLLDGETEAKRFAAAAQSKLSPGEVPSRPIIASTDPNEVRSNDCPDVVKMI